MKFTRYVKLRQEKFGMVVFETLREKVFVTNQTGKEILKLLKKGYSEEEIINSLLEIYNKDRPQISADVKEFIQQLKENKIIE